MDESNKNVFELFHIDAREIRFNYFFYELFQTMGKQSVLKDFCCSLVPSFANESISNSNLYSYPDYSIKNNKPDLLICDNKDPKKACHLICIENKILSSEGKNQTKRYEDNFNIKDDSEINNAVFIFLTLNGEKAESKLFKPMKHEDFCNHLTLFEDHFTDIEKIIFSDYSDMVKKYSEYNIHSAISSIAAHPWRSKVIEGIVTGNNEIDNYKGVKKFDKCTVEFGASNETMINFYRDEWTATSSLENNWDGESNPCDFWCISVSLVFDAAFTSISCNMAITPKVEHWSKLTNTSQKLKEWAEIEQLIDPSRNATRRRWGWQKIELTAVSNKNVKTILDDFFKSGIWQIANDKCSILTSRR